MNERDELARTIEDVDIANEWDPSPGMYLKYGDAILAAGYRKPRTITTTEELDALAVGTVVLSEKYIHHTTGMGISFQKWDDWLWHRGGRSSDTHPDYFLPATVLWEPR